MSLDISLKKELFSLNITHNLTEMAEEAGIYECIWTPNEVGIWEARDLIEPLSKGLEKLKADPEHFKQFNAENGWGTYENFVKFVEEYLQACRVLPDAEVEADR